jgi:hypothetical protein
MLPLTGTMNDQLKNTFNVNGPPGNGLVLLDGRSITSSGPMSGPMTGGRKRRHGRKVLMSRSRGRGQSRGQSRGRGRSRGIRGGFVGSVINQAVVPLALLGLQQTYGRRGTGFKGKKSRRGRRRR